jgi:hypothetical protein
MRGAQDGRRVVLVLRPMVSGALALTWVACSFQPAQKSNQSGSGGDSSSSGSTDSTATGASSTSSSASGSGGATGAGVTTGSAGTTGSVTTTGPASTTGSGGSSVDASVTGGSGGSTGGASGMDASAGAGGGPPKATNPNLTYTKITIHNRFLAEAVAIGDYNKDGILDIAAGRRWYAGPFVPNYNVAMGEHTYRDGHEDLPTTGAGIEINTGVSDSWSAYAYDFNGDGWDDIVQITASDMDPRIAGNTQGNPLNAGTGSWFQNPKNVGTGNWTKYQISADMKGEHKAFADMTGDGKPEILGSCKGCNPVQTWGYWQANWANPTAPWTFHPVTRTYTFKDGCCGWLHGLGAGDVNGDGKLDLLERSGVWLQPANGTGAWQFLNVAFSIPEFLGIEPDIGGGQMYSYDVDGDGMNDVVTSLNSHGYGLAWFKQGPAGMFTRQMIMNTPAEMAMYNNNAVSQLHTVALEDMDGDGLKDIVTGKTWLAHPYETNDPGGREPVVFFIFKLIRTPTVHFEPHIIDADSATNKAAGGAREFRVVDMNNDGILDIVVSNKRGLFVFLGKP